MLRIDNQFGERCLLTSFKDEVLRWPFSVWNNIPKERSENIFGAINVYLATFPEETQASMWALYKEAHVLCTMSHDRNTEDKMRKVFDGFESLLDFSHAHQWFVANGFTVEDKRVDEVNRTNNSDAMTILRHESTEINSFAHVIKMFAPILGTRICVLQKDVGTLHKEMVACKCFNRSAFNSWMPYCRITDYLAELAKNRSGSVDPALTCGMPLTSLEDYLMGLTLARRLAILPLKHATKPGSEPPTLIQYIYTYLNDMVKELKPNNWKDKGIGGESDRGGQEADSVGDNYRVAQDVIDELPIEAESALTKHFVTTCEAVGLTSTEEIDNALSIWHTLKEHKTYVLEDDFQIFIPALILRKPISPSIYRHITDRDARLAAIAIAAVRVYRDGFQDIYELLLAVRQERQLDELEMTMQNDHRFLKLNDEVQADLIECYPHRRPIEIRDKTCAGIKAIKLIMDVVKSHQWLGLSDPTNLPNSIAKLIIMESRNAKSKEPTISA